MASFLLRASLRLRSEEPVWDPTSRGDLSLGGLYWLDWQGAGLDSSLWEVAFSCYFTALATRS